MNDMVITKWSIVIILSCNAAMGVTNGRHQEGKGLCMSNTWISNETVSCWTLLKKGQLSHQNHGNNGV